ncbi:MAG TPA: hypothetical protein VNG90_05805, partial [Candidatus Acidoferrum sp.]|nr:hypothetical protein [Candidatus Acidoferrum sp.]
RHGQHHHPICAVTTMSGDIMYLTMFDQGLDDLDLITMAEKLTRGMLPIDEFGDVVFPMVDINQEVDVSWLVDMETFRQDGRRAWIAQAKQETSLRINEIRAAMRSAFTAEVANESMMVSRPDMVINGSFLCWFWRPGLSKPLLVSHVQREDWKNPGVIEPKK